MSIARIVEISSTSDKGFEDAVAQGVARASKTLRGIKSAWVKETGDTGRRRQDHRIQGDPEDHIRTR